MNHTFNRKKDIIIRLGIVFIIGIGVYFFGVKPMLTEKLSLPQPKPDNSWTMGKLAREPDRYDLIVVGEEPEGIAAAVSSARLGARTLLVSERQELGGIISRCLLTNMEISVGPEGEPLNRHILTELFKMPVGAFSVSAYTTSVQKLVKSERNLEVLTGVKINSIVINNVSLTGLNLSTKDKQNVVYNGKRFIDATRDGKVLELCKVPYFSGSEDLNLKNNYMPVRLNFVLEGVNPKEVEKLYRSGGSSFNTILYKYEPHHLNIHIADFGLSDQGDGTVIVQALEMSGVDVSDPAALSISYKAAVKEAEALTAYLKTQFAEFGNARFVKAADEFYIQEARHFIGEHQLSVNEILENTDFDSKIALGSYPVEAGKFASTSKRYIIGKPVQFSIPLGCIIPVKIDHLLMVGNKISYSSLAASSAAKIDTGVATGQAASIVAVYSIVEDATPRSIAARKDLKKIEELHQLFSNQGMNLPEFSYKNSNTDHWSYPAVRQLNNLGLLAGGMSNTYNFDIPARQEDLAILLLNGTYRLSREKYSLELDARLKPFFTRDTLTRETAGEILLAFHGKKVDPANAYPFACQQRFMSNVMELRLKDRKILNLDDVYYLSAYNVKLFTGKDIKD